MPKTQAMNATNEANGNYAATPQSNEIHSGVGVLDKTVKILDALESGPATLGQLVSRASRILTVLSSTPTPE